MVRAWYMDEDVSNPRAEHLTIPPKFVTLEELYKISGVEYYPIDLNKSDGEGSLKDLESKKEITQEQILENIDEQLGSLYIEHFYSEDSLHLLLEGCGYYDVRDKWDEWIRIELLQGDLILIPAGCYHRSTVDSQNVFTGKLVQKEASTSYERPNEEISCRKEYIRKLYNGAFDVDKNPTEISLG